LGGEDGVRGITKRQEQECIRLRVREQLSTPTIAKRVGICNTSVYKILRNHPWKPTEKKRATRGFDWWPNDNAALRHLWPFASRLEIMERFPDRKWETIGRQACQLKLRRMTEARRKAVHVLPMVEQLRAARESRRMTREELSKDCGYHVNDILRWELGRATPKLRHFIDWANALGFSVVLKLTLSAVHGEVALIRAPDKARLMAGR
jgi:DNA-binding XRE family transcriptional regulator